MKNELLETKMLKLKNSIQLLTIVIGAIALSGCASNPKLTMNYFLAKTTVNIKVTRTATCDLKNNIIVVSKAKITPVHSADLSAKKSIKLHDLNSQFANTDLTIAFYNDGRLKGINSTSTGQGQAIITSG